MSEITVIVEMRALPGREVALERKLRAAVSPTHGEQGCIRFALHRSSSQPNLFLLVERWASQHALDEHLGQPYLITLLAAIKELTESANAQTYQMLPEGNASKLL
ncbi:MAG: putative quinol monooxygenase [Burkholderiales bacterium]